MPSFVLRSALTTFVALCALLAVGDSVSREGSPVAESEARRPNFLFVLVDDLAASDVRMLSGLENTMVSEGLTFENAFATSTICCPSRVSILRGQYVHNHEIYTSKPPSGSESKFRQRAVDESTIATWLRAEPANYKTAYFGKYLNGYLDGYVPPGWDQWYGYVGNYQSGRYRINHNGTVREHGSGQHDTDELAEKAVKFLETTKDDERPFFLFFSTNAPHAPALVAPRHRDEFADAKLPRPPSFNERDLGDKPKWVRERSLLDGEQIGNMEERYSRRLRAMLSVEEALAGFVETLEEQGQLEDTYIVFTSDHGFHMGQHRLRDGKRSAYEEDIRIPLMIRGPGVPAGKSVEHLAITNDLAPTFADLADAQPPDFVDGRSLEPLLGNEPPALEDWRQSILVENFALDENGHSSFIPSYRAVRTADHTYVAYDTGERELYDLRADPYQLENLADGEEPQFADRLAENLRALKGCSGRACRIAENAGP